MIDSYKPRTTPLIKIEGNWQNLLIKEGTASNNISSETKRKLKDFAAKVLRDEVQIHKTIKESGSKKKELEFQRKLMNYGTKKDKVAAHVLNCMEAPLHSLNSLNILIEMVNVKSKGHFVEVLSSLKELFGSVFLSKGYVAKSFESHDLTCIAPLIVTSPEQAIKQLLLWYFEDQIRINYKTMIHQITFVSIF